MLTTILLILAITCFVLACIPVHGPWVPLGLIFFVLTFLLPRVGLT